MGSFKSLINAHSPLPAPCTVAAPTSCHAPCTTQLPRLQHFPLFPRFWLLRQLFPLLVPVFATEPSLHLGRLRLQRRRMQPNSLSSSRQRVTNAEQQQMQPRCPARLSKTAPRRPPGSAYYRPGQPSKGLRALPRSAQHAHHAVRALVHPRLLLLGQLDGLRLRVEEVAALRGGKQKGDGSRAG